MAALTYNNAFDIELRAVIADEINRVGDFIITGGGIIDYPTYQNKVGYMEALNRVLTFCDDVHEQLEKR